VSKAFREPVVDFSEHGAPFVTAIGVAQQSSEARRGAQLPGFRTHLLREHDRLAEVGLGHFDLTNFDPNFPTPGQNSGPIAGFLGGSP
jgi:hypothetical protein